jgi:hypothetical protein
MQRARQTIGTFGLPEECVTFAGGDVFSGAIGGVEPHPHRGGTESLSDAGSRAGAALAWFSGCKS